jgi:dihydrofolate reductase
MNNIKANITMSLDGYVAGPEPSLDDPLGRGGELLHEWLFPLASFREEHGSGTGGETGPEDDLNRSLVDGTGAYVMGRRMFSGGSGAWADDPKANGWWGDEPPFRAPVFVLTHHEREPLVLGATTFHFVTGGIDAALAAARDAAGERDVMVSGGADAVQQALRTGNVDELHLHVASVLLGGGTPLFAGDAPAFELVDVTAGKAAHLRYRVLR